MYDVAIHPIVVNSAPLFMYLLGILSSGASEYRSFITQKMQMNEAGHFISMNMVYIQVLMLLNIFRFIISFTIMFPYASTNIVKMNIAISSIIIKNAFVRILINELCFMPNSWFDAIISELVPFDIR